MSHEDSPGPGLSLGLAPAWQVMYNPTRLPLPVAEPPGGATPSRLVGISWSCADVGRKPRATMLPVCTWTELHWQVHRAELGAWATQAGTASASGRLRLQTDGQVFI